MPEQDPNPDAGTTEENPPAGTTDTPPADTSDKTDPPASDDKAPKWDGEFDPDRAAKLVSNLREELKETKAKLGEKEEAEKTEFERIQDRAATAEKEAADARLELMRLRVAKEHSLPEELMEFLTGDDEEALAEKAKRLSEFAAGPSSDDGGRPKPNLRPGNGENPATGAAPDFDPKAIAKKSRSY